MTAEIHEIAKRIIPVLRNRGVIEASVFGSIARGEDNPLSDLDLLVKYRDDVSLLDVVGLKNEIESILGVKVDLVSSDYLKPRLKDRVLSESRRIL
jgi:predicted nucleotidyltransferase